ncbi:MAG: transposase [Muribaculaceae bacterium]|nr:transposase [Muribaculaceae bacterium]
MGYLNSAIPLYSYVPTWLAEYMTKPEGEQLFPYGLARGCDGEYRSEDERRREHRLGAQLLLPIGKQRKVSATPEEHLWLMLSDQAERLDEERPAYWKDTVHSMLRRASWHDYRKRSMYMITLTRHTDWHRPFSTIVGTPAVLYGPEAVHIKLYLPGEIIIEELRNMLLNFPDIKLIKSVVMPDHLHIELFVRQDTDYHLGRAINFFKGNCTKIMRKADTAFATSGYGFFSKGYHDRIVTGEGQAARISRYIEDNPRRWAVRQANRDFFTKRHIISSEGRHFCAYGNIHLLRHPDRKAVKVSRRHSPEERHRLATHWYETARSGGVIISPFIHREEKRLRRDLMAIGAKVIHLQTEPFGERFKPMGAVFDLCAEGKVLILAPAALNTGCSDDLRKVACNLNDVAVQLASLMKRSGL